MGFQQDVTNFDGAKAMLAEVKECFGPIDMLVNNAGITRDKPLALMQEDDWRAVIETNLYGTIHFARAWCLVYETETWADCQYYLGKRPNRASWSNQLCCLQGWYYRLYQALAKRWRNTEVTVNAVSRGTSTRICWQPCRPRGADAGQDSHGTYWSAP